MDMLVFFFDNSFQISALQQTDSSALGEFHFKDGDKGRFVKIESLAYQKGTGRRFISGLRVSDADRFVPNSGAGERIPHQA